jgi:hypothetical protein
VTERPQTALGITDAPYRPVGERRVVARARLAKDRDCWFVTSSPEHGPYVVPLSFLTQGTSVYLFTQPHRPTVRNVKIEPRVLLVFGGYDEAVVAEGTCRTLALGELKPELIEKFVERAGWRPEDSFVALEVALSSLACSRSPDEHRDREVWRSGLPTFW